MSFLEWIGARLRPGPAVPPPPLDEALWQELVAALPILRGIDAASLARLRTLTETFIARKDFQGAGGHSVTVSQSATIAVQACLLVLELGVENYRGWSEIIVYPDEFIPTREAVDAAGVVHITRNIMVGEAWLHGPVILSWSEVAPAAGHVGDGFNVVVHEFAHKLDMLNGNANGFPPLHRGMSRGAWTHAFEEAYADLCRRADGGRYCALDPYATESPGEFFAVASEAFFEIPNRLKRCYSQVYDQLGLFYRQDPASRRSDY